jgi:hypothetical protein
MRKEPFQLDPVARLLLYNDHLHISTRLFFDRLGKGPVRAGETLLLVVHRHLGLCRRLAVNAGRYLQFELLAPTGKEQGRRRHHQNCSEHTLLHTRPP